MEGTFGSQSAVFCFLREVILNIGSVTNTQWTRPSYQQATQSSTYNPLDPLEKVACDITTVAGKVAPVFGLLGSIIDIFV